MLRRAVKLGDDKHCGSMNRKSGSLAASSLGKQSLKTQMDQKSVRKQQKSINRTTKHGPAPRVDHRNMDNLTFLETKNVSKSRNLSYQKAWEEFQTFVSREHIKTSTLMQLDAAAAWWIDQLFFAGEDVATVMTFMASVLQHRSDVVKMASMTRAMRSMKGFKKMAPGQSRVPLPFPMLSRIVE